jgi:hypothetical protein
MAERAVARANPATGSVRKEVLQAVLAAVLRGARRAGLPFWRGPGWPASAMASESWEVVERIGAASFPRAADRSAQLRQLLTAVGQGAARGDAQRDRRCGGR